MSKNISGLMHLGLRVKNYRKTLAFYCDALGFEKMFELTKKDLYQTMDQGSGEVKIRGDEDAIWLAYLRIKDEQYLEIFPVPDEEVLPYNEKQSFFHLSLQVDDIVEKVRALQELGVTVYGLHKAIEEGKPVPPEFVPLRGKCGSLIAWIHDPDGNLIELMQLTDQSLQRQYDQQHPY
jgi:catechol 2,3-dioxygenase-like lactoylglutathione lyase family enzyme